MPLWLNSLRPVDSQAWKPWLTSLCVHSVSTYFRILEFYRTAEASGQLLRRQPNLPSSIKWKRKEPFEYRSSPHRREHTPHTWVIDGKTSIWWETRKHGESTQGGTPAHCPSFQRKWDHTQNPPWSHGEWDKEWKRLVPNKQIQEASGTCTVCLDLAQEQAGCRTPLTPGPESCRRSKKPPWTLAGETSRLESPIKELRYTSQHRKPRRQDKNQKHHLANKGPSSQSYGFSTSHVRMWELDHKKGWVLENWCFWTVVLRRLLRVPWTARRMNHSILKEINPKYSLVGLMLKLKLPYLGHLMRRVNSLEKTLMLGKTEGRRSRDWYRMRWLNGMIKSMDISLSKLQEILKDRETSCAAIHGVAKSHPRISNWTTRTNVREQRRYLRATHQISWVMIQEQSRHHFYQKQAEEIISKQGGCLVSRQNSVKKNTQP